MADGIDRRQIVILGGGFGGLYAALHLERRLDAGTYELVLVNRHNYFLMTPLLFEAGSGVLEPRHAVTPIRAMLRSTRFVDADVEEVDFDGRVAYARHAGTDTLHELPYDQLVLALGGVTNRAVIPGSAHARGFKTLAEAIALRNHLIDTFERADLEEDPGRIKALMTVVVIGGGLVGIELAGELTEFIDTLCRTYPRVGRHPLRFYMIEAGPRVLAEMDEDLAAYARRTLENRGVCFLTGTAVEAIAPDRVTLPGGTAIPAATILLAAGVAPNPLLAAFPLTKDRKGRIQVAETLRSVDRPEVWALGDCASIPDPEGKPYPPLAQHALREAKVLAGNLVAAEAGRPLRPFVYASRGVLASLGAYAGVGQVMGLKLRGFAAWWVWRTYYLMQMPRLERKLRVLLDWTVALFFKNDIVQLDLEVPPPESARRREPERRQP